MRAFHLAVFGILAAGLASAAGYLWAPLVSPKFEALHLSAPPIESRLIEPPLRKRASLAQLHRDSAEAAALSEIIGAENVAMAQALAPRRFPLEFTDRRGVERNELR